MALAKSQKSLKKWTKQKWGYVTKGDEKNKKSLSESEKASTNKRKRQASKKRKFKAKYSKKIAKKVRNA